MGGEKEYYLASACAEIYVPPTGSVSLRGFAVSGTFLRGVLDKVCGDLGGVYGVGHLPAWCMKV